MKQHSPRRLHLILQVQHEGIPIRKLLQEELGISTSVIRRIKFLEDGILLDGVRVHTNRTGRAGQQLSALIGEEVRRSSMVPIFGELDIVYEDPDVVVINKQAGVVVHPSPGHYDDTIGNFLLYHYDRCGFGGEFHPVHRLDRGTSGLLVVAKHPFAQEKLTKQMKTPDFSREYVAIGWSKLTPSEGEIDLPIHCDGFMKRSVHQELGQHALTQYKTLKTGEIEGKLASHFWVKLQTGRTHQIRVHFSHCGAPLIGDPIYGQEFRGMARPALHAYRLQFCHPVSGERMSFEVAPPQDFEELLQELT